MTRYRNAAVATAPTIVFTARLHETSDLIEVIYTNVTGNTGQQGGTGSNGSSATVGIQAAASGTQFTQFSNETASLAAGRKLSFTRAAAICSPGPQTCLDPNAIFKNSFE